jgi:hypothetical protein
MHSRSHTQSLEDLLCLRGIAPHRVHAALFAPLGLVSRIVCPWTGVVLILVAETGVA